MFFDIFRIYVTNWGRVYLRKLAVIHLVNNFHFLRNPKINYNVRRQSVIGSHLSQSNPLHNLSQHFSKIHFNIILLFKLRRYNSSFLCMLSRLKSVCVIYCVGKGQVERSCESNDTPSGSTKFGEFLD